MSVTDLSQISYLKIGGTASIHTFSSHREIQRTWEEHKSGGKKLWVIGEGSNTVFSDNPDELDQYTFVRNAIKKAPTRHSGLDPESARVEFSGGMNWDDAVAWSVEHNLSGIEALSAIPGSVGAAPVQNIGAYGTELVDTLVSLTAFDWETGETKVFTKDECEFGYRTSFFKKKENRNRYIILSVTLELKDTQPVLIPEYRGVQTYFEQNNLEMSLSNIRKAITDIRWKKLPRPEVIPNCGSFFKNSIISRELFEDIKAAYPNIPHWKVDSGPSPERREIKLSAGWLIEQAGLKGLEFEDNPSLGTYKNHALIVVNREGKAKFDELKDLVGFMKNKVKEKFDVELEREVNFVE